ncbi:MAG: hypothetical protein RPU72_01910 [Candidatus Sedimenticola sp. (ex Thyasira tokunagai)]
MDREPTQTIRRGSIFSLGELADATLEELLLVVDNNFPKAAAVFQAILDIALEDTERRTDMASVCDQANVNSNQAAYRMKQLVTAGFATKGYEEPSALERSHKKKRCILYTLCKPDTTVMAVANRRSFTPEKIPEQLSLRMGEHIPAKIPWKGERLSVFTLLAAFRLGNRAQKGAESKLVPIYIGKERFDVEVSTEVGKATLGILDVRVLIAVFSLIHAHHQRGDLPKNGDLAVTLKEIIDRLPGWEDCGARRRQVLSSLQRAESTGFLIRTDGSSLVDHFDGQVSINEKFRLITKIRWVSFKQNGSELPEAIALKLDDDLYARLIGQEAENLLSIHDSALAEKNPFTLMFYFWCRRAIGHHGGKSHPRTIIHLNREITPLYPKWKFKGMVLDMISRHLQVGDTALIHGYKVTYSEESDLLWIWPDESDELIGRNSYYALKQEGIDPIE